MSALGRMVRVAGMVAGAALAATALAPEARALGMLDDWQVGTLAFGWADPAFASPTAAEAPERIAGLHDAKIRVGASSLSGFGIGAVARSFVGAAPGPDGTIQGISGVLIDVPFGAFVFTPSIGAGLVAPGALDGEPVAALRSQVELGYEFENRSRFTLGYSRITDVGIGESRAPENVFGLHYRLPIGSITGAIAGQ